MLLRRVTVNIGQIVYSPNHKAFVTVATDNNSKENLYLAAEEYADLTGQGHVKVTIVLIYNTWTYFIIFVFFLKSWELWPNWLDLMEWGILEKDLWDMWQVKWTSWRYSGQHSGQHSAVKHYNLVKIVFSFSCTWLWSLENLVFYNKHVLGVTAVKTLLEHAYYLPVYTLMSFTTGYTVDQKERLHFQKRVNSLWTKCPLYMFIQFLSTFIFNFFRN